MSANTKIEWADHTFNPWIGCTKVSPGCDNCYAEVSTPSRVNAVQWGPHAARRRTSPANWTLPLRWNGGAAAFMARHGRRQRVFCASLADVFDNAVDPAWRMDLFYLISQTPNLDWLVLTKRVGNVRKMVPASWLEPGGWPAHVRIGATICNQPEADCDIAKLLALPCPNFLSIEPLLGPVDLTNIEVPRAVGIEVFSALEYDGDPDDDVELGTRTIEWVIVGGESGPRARPMHPDWVRSLRDQCGAAGVPFLFKQWGEWTEFEPDLPAIEVDPASAQGKALAARCDAFLSVDGHCVDAIEKTVHGVRYRGMSRVSKKQAGRLFDGRTHDGFPS